jgi:putative heme transporter
MTDRRPPLRRLGERCLALALLILGAIVVYYGAQLASTLRIVVLPTMLALVLAALLVAPVRWLRGRGLPPAAAALGVLVAVLLVVVALGAWIVPQVTDQLGELSDGLREGLGQVRDWLVDGPLGLSQNQIDAAFDQLQQFVQDNIGSLAQLGLSGASILLQVLAGLLLAFVVLFFFLKDGEQLWHGLLSFVPRRHRDRVRVGGEGGWAALGAFLRGQTLVAAFDAVFIGLGLLIVGVPIALPLIVITFLAAYVPYIGAFTAGAAAVLIALVSLGVTPALVVLGIIVVVQQLEGNVIEPIVMGRALDVHPLIVGLGVVTGGVLGGVIGSIVASPVLSALTGAVNALRAEGGEEDEP